MAWKKYFKDANMSPISGEKLHHFAKRNYSSYLPDVYTGHPNRIQRYFQYDQMDSDSEINAALDILAEFSTQTNTENETPFDLVFKDETTEHEVKLLKKALQQWTNSNQFQKRIFRIFRNALKYGDCFFVRDPETQKWLYIDNAKVDRIVVNESEGKVSDLYNFQDLQIGYLQTDNLGEKKQLGRSLCNLDELVLHHLHQENHYNHQNSVKLWDEQLILFLFLACYLAV